MAKRTSWIVLFRGVGGATQLPVARLREALDGAGFENVATYINSGNAVLASALGREEIHARVAQVCRRELQFEKDIHLRSLDEWDALIASNPFKDMKEPRFLHAAVLESAPDAANVERLDTVASGGDAFAVIGRTAYLHTPQGFGTSKLAERFDRWIGVSNTARNWNSVLKLRKLAARANESG